MPPATTTTPGPHDARPAPGERADGHDDARGAAVLIRHVVKRYERHVAVDDLSLTVPRGTVYGLLGPNGAGKTTTIRMILNIIAPDAGEIAVLGSPVATTSITDRVGYLPEERGLYKKMQVRKMLRFLAELKGVPARVADARIDRWLERLALTTQMKDWGAAKVDELSRGMQQKVQFIGALVHEPELVILDEPFSGLDPINAQALKDTVVELKRAGKTVIFSTHLMENAERMCDAVCIISNGVKVLDGTVSDVKAGYGNGRVAITFGGAVEPRVLGDRSVVRSVGGEGHHRELELVDGTDPQLVLRRLMDEGATVERFEIVRPSLHEIFLEKVGAAGVETGMSGHG